MLMNFTMFWDIFHPFVTLRKTLFIETFYKKNIKSGNQLISSRILK